MHRYLLVLIFLIILFKPLPTQAADDRFGIGASCNITKFMNIPWIYSWGHGNQFPNSNEYNCIKATGRQAFFTLAKLSNEETYDLNQFQSDFPLDAEDQQLFNEIIVPISQKYTKGTNHIQASFITIPKFTSDYPGAYYAIGNEIDHSPYITPDDYAQLYFAFTTRLKKHDPTSKVSFGGLLWPMYNAPGHEKRTRLNNTQYIKQLINQGNKPAEFFRNSAYILTWLHNYQQRYSSPPPIDFYNIHSYPTSLTSLNNTSANIQNTKNQINHIRELMQYLGDENLPLWITEFSNYYPNCISTTDCESKKGPTIDYMNGLFPWLLTTKKVQKFFWFYGHGLNMEEPNGNPSWLHPNASFFLFSTAVHDQVNSVARRYIHFHDNLADSNPPILQNPIITTQNNSHIDIKVTSSDSESGLNEYWYSLGSTSGASNLTPWTSKAWISSQLTFSIDPRPFANSNLWINIKVRDAAGNFSPIKNLLLLSKSPTTTPTSIPPTLTPTPPPNTPTQTPTPISPTPTITPSLTLSPSSTPTPLLLDSDQDYDIDFLDLKASISKESQPSTPAFTHSSLINTYNYQ